MPMQIQIVGFSSKLVEHWSVIIKNDEIALSDTSYVSMLAYYFSDIEYLSVGLFRI